MNFEPRNSTRSRRRRFKAHYLTSVVLSVRGLISLPPSLCQCSVLRLSEESQSRSHCMSIEPKTCNSKSCPSTNWAMPPSRKYNTLHLTFNWNFKTVTKLFKLASVIFKYCNRLNRRKNPFYLQEKQVTTVAISSRKVKKYIFTSYGFKNVA